MSSQNRIVALAAAAAVMICALVPNGMAQESKSQEPPATAHLKAYLEAFNSGDPEQMRAFFEAHFAASALKEIPVEQRVTRFRGARSPKRAWPR